MGERLRKAFIGSMFLGVVTTAAACGTSNEKPPVSPSVTTESTRMRNNFNILKEGDSISSVRIVKPELGVPQIVDLLPTQTKVPEDLGVLYEPTYSNLLNRLAGSTQTGQDVGILFTTSTVGVFGRAVMFDDKTQKVTGFGLGQQLTRTERLMPPVNSQNETVVIVDAALLPGESPGVRFMINQPQPQGPVAPGPANHPTVTA